jgi:hypothetical protein
MSPFLRNSESRPMDGTHIYEPHDPPILETYSQGQHLPLTAWHQTGRSNLLGHVNNDAPLAPNHIAGRLWAARLRRLRPANMKYAPGNVTLR